MQSSSTTSEYSMDVPRVGRNGSDTWRLLLQQRQKIRETAAIAKTALNMMTIVKNKKEVVMRSGAKTIALPLGSQKHNLMGKHR